jgi:hypothetical protein
MRLGLDDLSRLTDMINAANALGTVTASVVFDDAVDVTVTANLVYVEGDNTHVFDFPVTQQQAS